jgi:putative restriction endonuclease
MSIIDPLDAAMRDAAMTELERRAAGRSLEAEDLAAGFLFRGERIPFVNPQRGIFKPRVMRFLLSIRTVYPRTGARVWYDDQRRVHQQIHSGEELIDYAFMGSDPDAADNRWLKEAMEAQVPVIYFLGIAPGRYTAIYPTFIADWSASKLAAKIGFGMPLISTAGAVTLPSPPERRYALRLVSQRLHQATFREAVLTAYGGRCAISRLPERRLLDAAHIVADRDELLGQPLVANGLPLSKVHHAAFDANLVGIDPDYRIHVSDELFAMNDGPMLEQGIKAMRGKTLLMPERQVDRPDRDRLAARFELYRAVN